MLLPDQLEDYQYHEIREYCNNWDKVQANLD